MRNQMTSFLIDRRILDRLDKTATAEGLNRSKLLRRIVVEYIEKVECKLAVQTNAYGAIVSSP